MKNKKRSHHLPPSGNSKIITPTPSNNKDVLLLPSALLLLMSAVWAIILLPHLNKNMPWRFLGGLFESGYEFNILSFGRVFLNVHIVNLFYALTIFLAAFSVGNFLIKIAFRKISFDRFTFEHFFLHTAVGLGVISTVVFISGYVGIIDFTATARAIILKVIIYVLALNGLIVLRNLYITTLKRDSDKNSPVVTRFLWYEKVIFIFIFLTSFINLLGALTPETFYDSQFYQLGVPWRWLIEGKISADNYVPASFMPFNINIIYMLAMFLSKGEPIVAKLVHYLCGILITLTLYSFGKRVFSRTAGLISALVFSSIPVVMMVSWKSATELGIGVFEFAALVSLLRIFDEPLSPQTSTTNNFNMDKKILWVALAGLLCGFSVGSKYTSLVFCYMPLVMTILIFKGLGENFKYRFVLAAVFSFFVLVASSPWYLRNFLTTRNPIHPFLWEKFSRLPLKAGNNLFADPAPPAFSIKNYLGFLWPLTMGTLQQESYPGGVFLVFIPLFLGLKKIDIRIKFLMIYVFFALIGWAKFGRFYLRYFIPSLVGISLVYSYYIANKEFWKNFALKLLLLSILLWVVFININFSSGILNSTQDPLGYVIGKVNKKDYLSTQRPSYPAPYYQAVDWINENLPSDAKILFMGETRPLYLKRKFRVSGAGEWWWFQEKLKEVKDADEFYHELRSDGITHILFNGPEARRLSGYEPFYFDEKMVKIFDDFWRKYVREVYRDISDIYLPQYGIRSIKNERPDWWKGYSSDSLNYVYVYEILPFNNVELRQKPPDNFLLKKEFYPERRWQLIEKIAQRQSRL